MIGLPGSVMSVTLTTVIPSFAFSNPSQLFSASNDRWLHNLIFHVTVSSIPSAVMIKGVSPISGGVYEMVLLLDPECAMPIPSA